MKPDDLQFLIKDIKNHMVVHNGTKSKTPMKFGPFPKNLKYFQHKVQNKFYNNYLSVVEEANHQKLLSNRFLNWFLNQHREFFLTADIGNHDNFLKLPRILHSPGFDVGDVALLASLNAGGVPGADLFSQFQGTGTVGAGWNEQAYADQLDNGTITDLYDQIHIDVRVTGSANIRLAVYDGNTRDPVNLYEETGSIAATADYSAKSVTEFALTSVINHVAFQTDNGTFEPENTGSSTSASLDSQTFGAFPDPYTNTNTVFTAKMKVTHS